MQPTFQTPWTKLEDAKHALLACGAGNEVTIRPILFLCGVKLSLTYYQASLTGDKRAQWASAGHLVDDGLDESCRRALAVLIKIAKSRDLHRTVGEFVKKVLNLEEFLLTLAFLELPEKLPPTVASWLRRGDEKVNWVRLSFGMGAVSLWRENAYIMKMMRKRFTFRDQQQKDITKQVGEIVQRFTWDPAWVLSEI
jgi:hypothetical protein